MAYNINNYGSIADALASYRDDIFDTISNIGDVFDVYSSLLLRTDDDTVTVDNSKFPLNIVFNDENISIAKESDGYHLYNGKSEDKGVLINNNFTINTILGYDAYDILNYINGSYTSNEILLEACDLALVQDDPDTDIASMLCSKYAPQASSLTGEAKGALDQIVTYMQHSDRGPTGVAGFISELYASINDTLVDSNGVYYEASDKNWRIQGFVGAYAIRAIVRSAATIISAVVAVVKPLIGIAVGLLCGALSKLKDWFVSFTSSKVHVNARVTNNLLNMSMFDYDIAAVDMPSQVYQYFIDHPSESSVSYRMAGCTWIFAKKSVGYHLQIMANIEYHYNINSAVGVLANGVYTTLSNTTVANYFYNNVRTYDNYTTAVNTDINVDQDMFDAQAINSLMSAYDWIFGLLAAMVYGYGYSATRSSSMPSDGNTFDNAAWLYDHHTYGTVSWSTIVSYRNMLRGATSVGPRLCQLLQNLLSNGSIAGETTVLVRHLSFPWVSKFYMEVPNYTSGAVWGTILATAAVATVAIFIAIKANKIKKKIRKFMARKQLDVEAKRYAYENAAPADKDRLFDEYWKEMRSFNKWTILTRYNKIDYTTGYMTSDSEEVNNGGYGVNVAKKVYNNKTSSYEAVDLATLYKLIAG